MRAEFYGYYAPTEDEYKRLLTEGLIVLDTNVLLGLYRLPTIARNEFLTVLKQVSSRVWIPYQVALEYQRNRLNVIAAEKRAPENTLSLIRERMEEICQKVNDLQLEKRDLGIDSKPLVEKFKEAGEGLTKALEEVHSAQLDIVSKDSIRDEIDALLKGKVGAPPANRDELDRLIEKGDERYGLDVPPGFADITKSKDGVPSLYSHDGLTYNRQFGDLILWRQILDHARASGVKNILLVTADRKEDWWWREQGRTLGPHPQLAREAKREAGVDLFWMYSSSEFLKHASEATSTQISPDSVSEVEQSIRSSNQGRNALLWDDQALPGSMLRMLKEQRSPSEILFVLQRKVTEWLTKKGCTVFVQDNEFPDLVAFHDESRHGYEIKYQPSFARNIFSPAVVQAILRGYVEVSEGRLDEFSLVLVLSEQDALGALENLAALEERMDSLLAKYPVTSMIVGALAMSEFRVVTQRFGPK